MSYEVLARKYRPSNFEEVVGQSHIIQALSNSISQDKIHQAYIFSGTRGVGKTTLARILSKRLNCLSAKNPVTVPCDTCNSCVEITAGRHLDFLEIDANLLQLRPLERKDIKIIYQGCAEGKYCYPEVIKSL